MVREKIVETPERKRHAKPVDVKVDEGTRMNGKRMPKDVKVFRKTLEAIIGNFHNPEVPEALQTELDYILR